MAVDLQPRTAYEVLKIEEARKAKAYYRGTGAMLRWWLANHQILQTIDASLARRRAERGIDRRGRTIHPDAESAHPMTDPG